MKIAYVLLLISLFSFAGCKKDPSNEKIYNNMLGKWFDVRGTNQDECISKNWREFRDDGTYAEYDECIGKILDNNAGTWRVHTEEGIRYLVLKPRIFPMDLFYAISYLSKTQLKATHQNAGKLDCVKE